MTEIFSDYSITLNVSLWFHCDSAVTHEDPTVVPQTTGLCSKKVTEKYTTFYFKYSIFITIFVYMNTDFFSLSIYETNVNNWKYIL